jgi:hypothetical protein
VPKGSPFSPTNFCRAEWTALAIHATDLAPSAARSPNEVGFGAPFAVAHPDEQTLGVDVAGLEGETSLRRRPSAWIVVSATRRTGWAEKTEDGPVALQRVQKEEPQRVDGEVDGMNCLAASCVRGRKSLRRMSAHIRSPTSATSPWLPPGRPRRPRVAADGRPSQVKWAPGDGDPAWAIVDPSGW